MQSRHKEILESLQKTMPDELLVCESREDSIGQGSAAKQFSLWVTVQRESLRPLVSFLKRFGPLHVSTPMASKEFAASFELIYPLALFGGCAGVQELPIVITVRLPIEDLRVYTLSDLIAGIAFMERETVEMLGVRIEGLSGDARLWTCDKLPKDFKPMRGVLHTPPPSEVVSKAEELVDESK